MNEVASIPPVILPVTHEAFVPTTDGGFNRLVIIGMEDCTTLGLFGGPAADIMWAKSRVFPLGAYITQIGVRVSFSGAGSSCRLGIYTNTSRFIQYPDKLIFDSGNLSTASTGYKSATMTQPLFLEPGQKYWFTVVHSATAPVYYALDSNGNSVELGTDSTLSSTNAVGIGLTVGFTFGALPNIFPAGATILTRTVSFPAIGVLIKKTHYE